MQSQFSRCVLLVVLGTLIGLVLSRPTGRVGAQSGGIYDLAWSTIDSGGAMFSTGGGYSLGGTIGQPDAGAALSGGSYTLVGGFWAGASVGYKVYLPLVLK